MFVGDGARMLANISASATCTMYCSSLVNLAQFAEWTASASDRSDMSYSFRAMIGSIVFVCGLLFLRFEACRLEVTVA
jgi:hypothetical protein